jgi:SAM-dependent methyltransferase
LDRSADSPLDPHRRFDVVASGYAIARPAYPPDAVRWLLDETSAEPGAEAMDLAAGTGALTGPLAEAGLAVTAVEPSGPMRAVLAERVPSAEIVDAVAESLPFADGRFELVTVANAWHWFRPETANPEIRRVLAADGRLAVVWNVEDRDDELSRRVDDLKLGILGLAAAPGPHEEQPLGWDREFETAARAEFRHIHCPPGIVEYVSSWSPVANMPADDRERFLDGVREWAPEGPVELPFRVTVTLGRPRPGAA